MKRLGFLVSGGGSNMQAIFDAIAAGKIDACAAVVISSRADAYALERAKSVGIPVFVVSSRELEAKERDRIIEAILDDYKVDYVVLAGYLSILTAELVNKFPKRILNIHPALLPKFGGAGMYGHYVHEAVLAAGEQFSGATVHYVDAGTDTGEIIAQRTVPVKPDDTADTLAARVLHDAEHLLFAEVLANLCKQ